MSMFLVRQNIYGPSPLMTFFSIEIYLPCLSFIIRMCVCIYIYLKYVYLDCHLPRAGLRAVLRAVLHNHLKLTNTL